VEQIRAHAKRWVHGRKRSLPSGSPHRRHTTRLAAIGLTLTPTAQIGWSSLSESITHLDEGQLSLLSMHDSKENGPPRLLSRTLTRAGRIEFKGGIHLSAVTMSAGLCLHSLEFTLAPQPLNSFKSGEDLRR
jgi:hypothetical protein